MRWSCLWLVVVVAGAAWADECPLDKHPFPFVNVKLGTPTGTRLDLRPIGTGVLLVPLRRCSECGLVAAWPLTVDAYKDKLPAILATPASKAAKAQPSSRFFLAVVASQLPVPAKNLGRTWLEAAWETEGVDEPRHRQSLEAALVAFRAAEVALATSPPVTLGWLLEYTEDEPRTVRLMQVELLRQLGRFAEATAALDVLARLAEFCRGTYPSLLEQERSLIEASDARPTELHRVTYTAEDDDPAFVMARSVEGYSTFSRAFTLERPRVGSINTEDEALVVSVRSKAPRLVDSAWWWNLLDEHGQPKVTYLQFADVLKTAEGVASKHSWLKEWKDAHPDNHVELQLVGTRPWTRLGIHEARARWTALGLPSAPGFLFVLRRGRRNCRDLVLSEDGSVAMVLNHVAACASSHWVDEADLDRGSKVLVIKPDGTHEVIAAGYADERGDAGPPVRDPFLRGLR